MWYDVLGRAVELSSMGIRVDREALVRQLKDSGKEERLNLYFHRRLMEGSLPLSVGGGIGQSRLCMDFTSARRTSARYRPASGPDDMRRECAEMHIELI